VPSPLLPVATLVSILCGARAIIGTDDCIDRLLIFLPANLGHLSLTMGPVFLNAYLSSVSFDMIDGVDLLLDRIFVCWLRPLGVVIAASSDPYLQTHSMGL
jgi:hypothetical protein